MYLFTKFHNKSGTVLDAKKNPIANNSVYIYTITTYKPYFALAKQGEIIMPSSKIDT